jgi:hypothetical protein
VVIVRERDWTPPPHASVHAPQSPKVEVTIQSTGQAAVLQLSVS